MSETRESVPMPADMTEKLLSMLGLCARARRLIIGTPMVCEEMRRAGVPSEPAPAPAEADREPAGRKAPGRKKARSAPGKADDRRIRAVIEAADTSDNTHKKLVSKCAFYHVPLFRTEAGGAEVAHAIGKDRPVAAVAVTDAELFRALSRYLPPEQSAGETDPSA